jgi:hypothetical protein
MNERPAETPALHARGRPRLVVRGLQKVKAVALWFATARDLARRFALQPQALPTGQPSAPRSPDFF